MAKLEFNIKLEGAEWMCRYLEHLANAMGALGCAIALDNIFGSLVELNRWQLTANDELWAAMECAKAGDLLDTDRDPCEGGVARHERNPDKQ